MWFCEDQQLGQEEKVTDWLRAWHVIKTTHDTIIRSIGKSNIGSDSLFGESNIV